jgi:Ni/Fe-hydrogenase subunit HybB-like protein
MELEISYSRSFLIMSQSVFVEFEFWLLVMFSIVFPAAIIWVCLTIRKVSRNHVLALGLLLVAIAGVDIYLLQALKRRSQETPSTADDLIFNSEITVGLYVLPALLAGIGVNIASYVVIQHLSDAQRRFARQGKGDSDEQGRSA